MPTTLKNIGSSRYVRRKTGVIVEPGETFVPGEHELRKITMTFELGTRLEIVPDEDGPKDPPIGDPPREDTPAGSVESPVVEDKPTDPAVPEVPVVTAPKVAKGQAKRA